MARILSYICNPNYTFEENLVAMIRATPGNGNIREKLGREMVSGDIIAEGISKNTDNRLTKGNTKVTIHGNPQALLKGTVALYYDRVNLFTFGYNVNNELIIASEHNPIKVSITAFDKENETKKVELRNEILQALGLRKSEKETEVFKITNIEEKSTGLYLVKVALHVDNPLYCVDFKYEEETGDYREEFKIYVKNT